MNLQFADNVSVKLDQILNIALPDSKKVRIAVAFVKYSGVRLIETALDTCLDRGGEIEFIIGLDFRTTDALSLRALHTRSRTNSQFRVYCYSDPADNTRSYHPKLYLLDMPASVKGIIGSSNLTQGGLRDNVEINAVLDFRPDDDRLDSLRDFYARLKYRPTCFSPDDDYIAAYEDLAKRIERVNTPKTQSDEKISKALAALREKEQKLPRPFTPPQALTSWQQMVYAKLPNHEFGTNDLYLYADEFRQAYPRNRFVEAKTRQVLQQLRDLGLVIHLGQNRWLRHSNSAT